MPSRHSPHFFCAPFGVRWQSHRFYGLTAISQLIIVENAAPPSQQIPTRVHPTRIHVKIPCAPSKTPPPLPPPRLPPPRRSRRRLPHLRRQTPPRPRLHTSQLSHPQ